MIPSERTPSERTPSERITPEIKPMHRECSAYGHLYHTADMILPLTVDTVISPERPGVDTTLHHGDDITNDAVEF